MLPYLTLFAWAFLAATIVPIGSEPVLAAIVYSSGKMVLPVLIATAGNYLGACTTYWIGLSAAKLIEKKQDVKVSEMRAMRLLERYGSPALLLAWVPWIGDPLVAVAGAARIRFLPFTLWTVTGKLARYAFVAWIAVSMG